jgi:predicted protein tyrosine phosphatase
MADTDQTKRQKRSYTAEEVFAMIMESESDSAGGMSSGEESDIDRQLQNSSDGLR